MRQIFREWYAEVIGAYLAGRKLYFALVDSTAGAIDPADGGMNRMSDLTYNHIGGIKELTWTWDTLAARVFDAVNFSNNFKTANTGGDAEVAVILDSPDPLLAYPITGGNQGAKEFTIAGDANTPLAFPRTFIFAVSGSTGNDQNFTVASAVHAAGTVTITVEEAIPSAVFDGDANGFDPANVRLFYADSESAGLPADLNGTNANIGFDSSGIVRIGPAV